MLHIPCFITIKMKISNNCALVIDYDIIDMSIFRKVKYMCKKKVREKNSFIYLIQATLTTPLMYPCLSAKSTALRAALPFLFLVRALKTLPGPFLWDLITRPILLQYNILNEFSLLHFSETVANCYISLHSLKIISMIKAIHVHIYTIIATITSYWNYILKYKCTIILMDCLEN